MLKIQRHQESLDFAIEGMLPIFNNITACLVIKRKEQLHGRESKLFLAYFIELIKVFNQTGMELMNTERNKQS